MLQKRYQKLFTFLASVLLLFSACSTATSSNSIKTVPTLPTHVVTPQPNNFKGFSFEKNEIEWDTSEGNYKLAALQLTQKRVHSGIQSLQITTLLRGDGVPRFQPIQGHTETKVDMYNFMPGGYSKFAPYDWKNKLVSAWVWFPQTLIGSQVDLYVADTAWRNERQFFMLDKNTTDTWVKVSLQVGKGIDDTCNIPNCFNARSIRAIGIRIETPQGIGSKVDLPNVSFYVDDVQLP